MLHKTDGSNANRLLFFLEEKKQKKIKFGRVASLRFCCFRQRAAQNGRFTYEPSVFSVPSRTCEKVSYLRITSSPAVSFVSFLQEKKSFSFLFFLERKENKRKSSAEQLLFAAVVFFANMLHKTDGSNANRLLFFLEEKKQKKIKFGRVASLPTCGFPQHAAQNGRFTYEPSVFMS